MNEMSAYHIGNTPMVQIDSLNGNRIFIKLEQENFLGSIKARTGYYIISNLPKAAEGRTIVESTSGNLGLALSFFCKETGRDFLCLIDSTIASAKLKRLEEQGVRYEMVVGRSGMDLRSCRIERARELMESNHYYWVNQYDNASGIAAHEQTTAPEIWEQTGHSLTAAVCAVGSGGTICGVSKFLKSKNSRITICGVEPLGSTVFGSIKGNYINVGAGLAGKPGNLIRSGAEVDIAYSIPDSESIECANLLYKRYGLAVGVTSGMAFAGVRRLAESTQNGTIVFIAPDGRKSYDTYLGCGM